MSLDSLDERDVETLTNLLLRTHQSRAREALCIRIGVDPSQLGFIKNSSDSDFVIQLINYLNKIDNRESLCKLCCKELFPIFQNHKAHAPALKNITAKLNCNQIPVPQPKPVPQPIRRFLIVRLIAGSATLIIGGVSVWQLIHECGGIRGTLPSRIDALVKTKGIEAREVFEYQGECIYRGEWFDGNQIVRKRTLRANLTNNILTLKAEDETEDTHIGTIKGNRIEDGRWYNPHNDTWSGTFKADLYFSR